jgi:hypothetical protein
MKDVRLPGFLTDVYRDLRDRHLLLPVVALIVALVAVPMVLANEEAPPPLGPPPPTDETAATVPAVVAGTEVSVRDYTKRLEELKSKNPFDQQFPAASLDTLDESGAESGTSTGTTTADAGGLSLGATAGTTSTPSDTAPDTGAGATDNTSGDPDEDDPEPVDRLFVRRVDVLVGIQGDLKSRKGVEPMTVLPNDATPVLAFLGTDEAGKQAAFVLSSDVSSVGGDGTCVPSPNCLFITLEKGESVTLDYDPNGQTYELKLQAIRNVKLKDG